MKINIFEMQELQADEDMVLTNGKTYSSIGGIVYLGINDKVENWYEISENEYNDIMQQLEQEEELI